MRLNTLGSVLLIFAFLLACAGIAEPSSALSAVSAALLLVGFGIITVTFHNTWASGYSAAQLDMEFVDYDSEFDGRRGIKCGSDDCHCKSDPTYVEVGK